MILLDLDPNIVKPGWTPFLITIGLAAVMYLLFRSMRRQFRRVDVNYAVPAPGDQPTTPADSVPVAQGAEPTARTAAPATGAVSPASSTAAPPTDRPGPQS